MKHILNETYFEKVSQKQLVRDKLDTLDIEALELPKRATVGSCGYDIHIPFDVTIAPNETIKIPTLLKCKIDDGWFLMIAPRSGLGFKYRCKLDNTIGIIDSDYFNNIDNEGHIWVKMTNEGTKDIVLKQNDAFCQGIFLPYGILGGDDADGQRIGGFGSTSK